MPSRLRLAEIALLAAVTALTGAAAPSAAKNRPPIPEGEAQISPEGLQQYARVYQAPDVRYLRQLFTAYLAGKPVEAGEKKCLDAWDRAYFKSRFVVLSRDPGTMGITFILLIAKDRPDRVFEAGVYDRGEGKLVLRTLEDSGYTAEDVRRIPIRYRQFFQDSSPMM